MSWYIKKKCEETLEYKQTTWVKVINLMINKRPANIRLKVMKRAIQTPSYMDLPHLSRWFLLEGMMCISLIRQPYVIIA